MDAIEDHALVYTFAADVYTKHATSTGEEERYIFEGDLKWEKNQAHWAGVLDENPYRVFFSPESGETDDPHTIKMRVRYGDQVDQLMDCWKLTLQSEAE